jgi:hypothetical protein
MRNRVPCHGVAESPQRSLVNFGEWRPMQTERNPWGSRESAVIMMEIRLGRIRRRGRSGWDGG